MELIGITVREVFTWHDATAGDFVFDVTGLRGFIAEHPGLFQTRALTLHFDLYASVAPRVEAAKARALTREQVNDPVIVLEWSDGTHLLIDGAHRLWRRWHESQGEVHAYVLPRAFWHRYVL